jgi:hypothetical protein
MTTGSPRSGGAHAPGTHDGGRGGGRRAAIVIGIVILVLLAFGGGYLLARDDGDTNAASPSATRSHSPSPSDTTPSETPSESPSPSSSASPSPPPVIGDGRHFVFAKRAKAEGAWSLTFDLAYYLTDQAAIDACGGDIPNGYCIVNDNPKLRTLPVARTVIVRYIPNDACCTPRIGNFPAFAEAINGTAQTDYEPNAPWWVTVVDGQIVRIIQPYLP